MAGKGAAPGERRGGRQKGTPNANKAELRARIQEKCPGYDPVVAMAVIANDPDESKEMRFAAHKEVAQYVEPKLKAIEHSGSGGGEIQHRHRVEWVIKDPAAKD